MLPLPSLSLLPRHQRTQCVLPLPTHEGLSRPRQGLQGLLPRTSLGASLADGGGGRILDGAPGALPHSYSSTALAAADLGIHAVTQGLDGFLLLFAASQVGLQGLAVREADGLNAQHILQLGASQAVHALGLQHLLPSELLRAGRQPRMLRCGRRCISAPSAAVVVWPALVRGLPTTWPHAKLRRASRSTIVTKEWPVGERVLHGVRRSPHSLLPLIPHDRRMGPPGIHVDQTPYVVGPPRASGQSVPDKHELDAEPVRALAIAIIGPDLVPTHRGVVVEQEAVTRLQEPRSGGRANLELRAQDRIHALPTRPKAGEGFVLYHCILPLLVEDLLSRDLRELASHHPELQSLESRLRVPEGVGAAALDGCLQL
mmetsp:Transcript_22835/g.51256  ORF Transcript_22835/g.51256 Transcript_22835/m.51256 type:complete len:372 (-) Transcript_22835:382-1497(-)